MKKFLVVLALVAFAASAMAADWGLYGSMRFATFYVNVDKDYVKASNQNHQNYPDNKSYTDLGVFGLQGNSRLGANIKVNDKLTGKIELAISNDTKESGYVTKTGVNLRLYYGQYDFGAFKLRIGQDYTPTDVAASGYFDQVISDDNDLAGFGAYYESRKEQVKFIFPFGLEFALVKNAQTDTKKYDVTTPRFEASYAVKAGMVNGKVFGAYQTYSAETESATIFDTSSYVVGAAAKVKAGMVGVSATGFYGSNLKAVGPADTGKVLVAPKKDEDTTDYGFALAVFANPADNMKVEVGYGYQASDNDGMKQKNDAQSYYVNLKYTVAKGFFIQPEIAVIDYMENDGGKKDDTAVKVVKEGKATYFGAKWQMDF